MDDKENCDNMNIPGRGCAGYAEFVMTWLGLNVAISCATPSKRTTMDSHVGTLVHKGEPDIREVYKSTNHVVILGNMLQSQTEQKKCSGIHSSRRVAIVANFNVTTPLRCHFNS